ncbi:MAG TPA: hypothetical protein VHZ53_10815 [Steroidobacteraceae bacterium]|jgi:hypothetical protein|nr:hypothetical protein [Steroidobacteraceae bacterium]
MKNLINLGRGCVALALVVFATGCVVAEPREGYYDHDHHRYYHEHTWHECTEHDNFCR